ncbi:MAG: glycosyltransferase family 2 protein [Pseudomonadota bacterium]
MPTLLTCIGVEHDLEMLPHFLRHYLDLGVAPERIAPILQTTDPDSANLTRAREILAAHDVAPAQIWTEPYTSEAMWTQRRALQTRLCGPGDWVISADLDEFHHYPEPLPAFLARCAEMGVDCVQGVFIDRLAPGGALAPVRATPALAEQFPVRAEVALSIAGKGAWHDRIGTVKMMAMRADILPGRGGHRTWKGQDARHLYNAPLNDFRQIERPAYRFAVPTRVDHFHWTDSLADRLRTRIATPGVSKAGAEYGRKQLDHMDRHGGIALDRVALMDDDAGAEDWTVTLDRMRRTGRRRAALSRVTTLLGAGR